MMWVCARAHMHTHIPMQIRTCTPTFPCKSAHACMRSYSPSKGGSREVTPGAHRLAPWGQGLVAVVRRLEGGEEGAGVRPVLRLLQAKQIRLPSTQRHSHGCVESTGGSGARSMGAWSVARGPVARSRPFAAALTSLRFSSSTIRGPRHCHIR